MLDALRELARQHDQDPAVRALLRRCGERPRVGACTLDSPVHISLPDSHAVQVLWPAIGVDVDVVFLVHDGPLSARIRNRMAAGPAEFVVVRSVAEIPVAWNGLDPDLLERARARALWHGLMGLGISLPALSEPSTPCRVCVLGPDPEDRRRVRGLIEAAGFSIDNSAGADVVVAVAPAAGWSPQDYPMLKEGFHLIGRMIVTAALPSGVCPEARCSAEAELARAVWQSMSDPPLAPLPDRQESAWERSAARLAQARASRRPSLPTGVAGADALVITIMVVLGLAKLLPVGLAVIVAVVVGCLRLWVRLRSVAPDSVPSSSQWLRRKMAATQ